MTPCINYHGYNMTLSDYNNSLNSIVNFKIYLSHKYKVLISEISWPIIVKYLQSLKEKKLLYIQPVKEVTAFSGKITLLKEYGFYLMQINNSLDIPESRKRFTIVHELVHMIVQLSKKLSFDPDYKPLLHLNSLPLQTKNNYNFIENEINFAASDLFVSDNQLFVMAQKQYYFSDMVSYTFLSPSAMQTRLHNFLVYRLNASFEDAKALVNAFRYNHDLSLLELLTLQDEVSLYFNTICEWDASQSYNNFIQEFNSVFNSELNWHAKRCFYYNVLNKTTNRQAV
ncbi:ImmA/IrrE family metallo-endopeptidase [Limosilactobacillus reuteri]|uniref:IrrE N-terminal-like domain-containing protein n=1 Tax=Limosilactobacillus reuteri subsp. rodentium (strain DSM 17509 / CIP 109821 / 100-23) TaxID=349123 RepID=B3XNL8_LIMR1|nr:hypothetical protein [Limosilactobacillus reuteri]EDX42724.1 hypothetical protein Lreu23DRAFT_4240 [Limosilactobacillus reuteri subsp. rodentium]MCC4474696.1 hypothetical protein [Limosilactobacillus reuteri]